MSEWGAFCTEFIGCKRCFEQVGVVFAEYGGRGTVEAQVVGDGCRIYAGYCSGLYSGEELFNFDNPLRDAIEARICHPIQVAVMCEAIDSRTILTYAPRETRGPDAQRAMNLARYIGASMYSLSDDERRKVVEYLQGEYCFECGMKQPAGRACQCWNDD